MAILLMAGKIQISYPVCPRPQSIIDRDLDFQPVECGDYTIKPIIFEFLFCICQKIKINHQIPSLAKSACRLTIER